MTSFILKNTHQDDKNKETNDPMDTEKPSEIKIPNVIPTTSNEKPQEIPLSSSPVQTLSAEELRKLRLARFNSIPNMPPPPTQEITVQLTKPVSVYSSNPIEIKRPEETRNSPQFSLSPKSPPLFHSPSPHSPSPLYSQSPVEIQPTFEVWENNIIKQIFNISLKSEERGFSRHPVIYLKKLANELTQDNQSLDQISKSLVDRIIIAVCSSEIPPAYTSLLDYFLKCFKTAYDERQKSVNLKNPERLDLLEHILFLIVSYIGIYLQYPSMFSINSKSPEAGFKHFVAMLESDSTSELQIPGDLLQRLIERFKGGGLQEIFQPIFDDISTKVLQTHLLGSFLHPLKAFTLLMRHKPLINLIQSLERWIPNKRKTAKEMEVQSYLGPFLRMSSLPNDLNSLELHNLFPEPVTINNEKDCIQKIRTQHQLVQIRCYEILMSMLRASRSHTMDWISTVLNRNRDRNKMNVDQITICSHGFLLNLTVVLLTLCGPITALVENKFKKIGSIDPDYLLKYSRLEISQDETRLSMDKNVLKSYISEISQKNSMEIDEGNSKNTEPNFNTECYFCTLYSLHLELVFLFAGYDRVVRNTMDMQKKTCLKAQLLDPKLLDSCFQFYNFTAAWLTRTAMGGFTNRPTSLPLTNPPKSFSALPEFIVEDLVEFLIFYITHQRLEPNSAFDDIMVFLVTFISSNEYIKNPYLRGRLIDLMGLLTPKQLKKLGIDLRYDPFDSSLAQDFLGPALIKFYIDIEITGASTQFYDKFNARFYVSLVMRHIWSLRTYHESFNKAFSDASLFLRFTNMLINDSIYLLDESFSKLIKIRKNEELFASAEWTTTPQSRQREIEQEHSTLERMVKTYLLLGRETTRMLHYISRDMAKHFMRPELRDRIAAMLNYFLVQLAGSNYNALSVKSREKYNFKPRWLLKMIATTYLNFVNFDEFPGCVARDGRSYNPVIFEDAGKLLLKNRIINEETSHKFTDFLRRVKDEAEAIARMDQSLEDAPERFLDPIMQTVMTNPVKLPTSNVTVDLVTITRHLLSTPHDPFNRMPLTVEQLIPDDELKAEIEAWMSSKK